MKNLFLFLSLVVMASSISLFAEHGNFKPLPRSGRAQVGDNNAIGKSQADKSVSWGYTLKYEQGLSSQKLKELRNLLKSKGVKIEYPSDKDWEMPTGYLSVSSYMDEEELKNLTQDFHVSVEPQEKTKRYTIQMMSGLTPAQVKKVREAFTKNKIQVMWNPPTDAPPYYSVKSALTADEIKGLKDIASFIESVEAQN
ncbi:MAG: hypothetical protein EB078_03265 [Proteobacteria bacterium]|nr:hypothetical protein [Pseudomonadota bacterium]NDC23699.1 hypothetical protein [Pseudomonadota bacterium]NDD03901.1 hypothetical protein [Pseudomonadota bacterium]NDG26276.1 hypothetical protein [Pseudomonadota bacterium]